MSRRVSPLPLGDGPESAAARMMGVPIERFREILPRLLSRGFPTPDPTTGHFDLDAINEWRRRRHPTLFYTPLASGQEPHDAKSATRARLEAFSG